MKKTKGFSSAKSASAGIKQDLTNLNPLSRDELQDVFKAYKQRIGMNPIRESRELTLISTEIEHQSSVTTTNGDDKNIK